MDSPAFFQFLSICLPAYLMGSIPSGYLLTRAYAAKDIRDYGSGNIGATNVRRIAGFKLGLATLLADVAKGAVPVFMLSVFLPSGDVQANRFLLAAAALAVFFGHLFPCFLKFKGGKGVATAAGCMGVISPLSCLLAFLVFVCGAAWTNRVSVGSLCAAFFLPFFVWFTRGSLVFTGCAFVMAVFIFLRHRENIRRLISGKEPRFWLKP